MTYSNNCPRSIDPELWADMSADARYKAQQEARRAAQQIGFVRWMLLLPPLAFVALPPVQRIIEKYLPPSHYVQLNGVADPRKFLDDRPMTTDDKVAGFAVTSEMSPARNNPLTGEVRSHDGTDIATPEGTPVYAPAVGADKVIVKCWFDNGGGGLVAEMSSESIPEYRFKLLHLNECDEGSHSAGKEIAATGNSGDSTGAHLHIGQLGASNDVYMQPSIGFAEWMLSGSTGADLIDIPALKESIIDQESAGDASIVNPHSGALGLGQVMPDNLEGEGVGWDYDALGRDVSTDEFLANPEIQTEIIEHQLSQIAIAEATDANGNKRDDVEIAKRAAAVWYSGRGDYCQSTAIETFGGQENKYPSGAEYCGSIGQKYEQSLQKRRLGELDKK